MDYRIKVAAQHFFSFIPGGRWANHVVRTKFTHWYPASDERISHYQGLVDKHLAKYRSVHGRNPETVFEIGSGPDLLMAIQLGRSGCKVTTIDTTPPRQHLVDDILRRLGSPSLEAVDVTSRSLDARNTGLLPSSFDLVVSHSVFEHLYEEDLVPISVECRRLLRPGGLCSFSIDYRDHSCYFDSSVTHHNFMRYSRWQWALLNPKINHQNRWRHSDFRRLFNEAGFKIVSEDIVNETIPRLDRHPDFSKYSKEDLEASMGWFVLC